MSTQKPLADGRNKRLFARLPFTGQVSYRLGAAEAGNATCCNIGRDGMCLVLNRKLPMGTLLLLNWSDARAEFKARITWSEDTLHPGVYTAGLRVLHDEPDSVAAMSDLLYDAERVNGGIDHLFEERVTPPATRDHLQLQAAVQRPAPKSWLQRVMFAAAAMFSIGMTFAGTALGL
jgi:hypothetical protein